MAKMFSRLDDTLQAFIDRQKIFFTATAPANGRINLSPKGMDTFRVLDERTVAYLDLTGSGNETAAHLEDDGRITIMFCSFDETPLILRLYGRGRVIRPGDHEWKTLCSRFPRLPGARQIIVLFMDSGQTSCGFGVPLCDSMQPRDTLREWALKKGEDGLRAYWRDRNQSSIDGLPTKLLEG
ncbi:MAG: pyridoxamine 5'-phosphate oxidase family protein [Gammaproteobacteria bacterium]|nr:pyridoxamine 5'-phosphate oxidase family protein [Gammaproteobacteria bacterium]NIT64985.1 pyridoxamine 5'-phosphate oxidase family protein [Gammaproteobacteria bacterium]NIV22004.1 pyridoxamine 5'-phosphate oxidase family protein [Gammaproteobacteria bacterium]NIY33564.1 pyridoxamine 5'-phosphate oxidase family protein [Gammaproteobacteria bacterium]